MPPVPRVAATLVVLIAILVVAGCGSEETTSGKTTQPTETAPPDPGREVMTAFVAAAEDGDAVAMWDLLSEPSRERFGPTLEEFEAGEAKRLAETLAPFAGGDLPVEVSENIDGDFGVVALSRGDHAYANPLRREGDVWRVELPGPMTIDISGPPPGSKGKFASQIGVEIKGRSSGGTALLYLDGETLDPDIYAGPTAATVFASFPNGVEPGRHTAVAFALSGDNAAAEAWTFRP